MRQLRSPCVCPPWSKPHHTSTNTNHAQGLDDESDELRTAYKSLHRARAALLEDQAARKQRLAEQKARCHDVQVLKFGQEIDLGLLDTIGVRHAAVDKLRAALKEQVQWFVCV